MRAPYSLLPALILVFSLLLLLAACGHPPPKPEPTQPVAGPIDDAPQSIARTEIDALVRPLLTSGEVSSIVVGVVDQKGARAFGYGASTYGPPNGDTVFALGSVTKLFTGLLMAQMIEEGQITANDPITRFIPAPKLGKTVTLAHLATHSSGFPTKAPRQDPRGHDLEAFLAQHTVYADPGTLFSYNNFGFGMLGYILSKHADTPLEALFQQRIFKPLGMTRTGVQPNLNADVKVATTDEGRLKDRVSTGSSELRSTANDMLKFLAAEVNHPAGARTDAMALSQIPRAPSWDGNQIGLAWHVHDRDGYVWHQGIFGGTRCYVGINPDNQTAVVVWSNSLSDYIDHVGLAVLHRLAGSPLMIPVVMPVRDTP